MPTWRWKTPRSRTCSAENSAAVSQARGDPDHVRRTRRADRASLPGNPAIAGGVLPIGHRSSIARRDSYHGSASYRDRGAALGVLEVSRTTACAGLRLESQAHLARVLPAAPELPRRTKRRVPHRERQPLRVEPRMNAVWALDFMRDTLYSGRVFRTLNVIDEANRGALGIDVAVSIPAARV